MWDSRESRERRDDMKTRSLQLLLATVLGAGLILPSERSEAVSSNTPDSVQLSFIAYSSNSGNNLYVDNVLVGGYSRVDLAVARVMGIEPDTGYSFGSSPFPVIPQAVLINAGSDPTPGQDTVQMLIQPGGYSSAGVVPSLQQGGEWTLRFEQFVITPGIAYDVTVFIKSVDDNSANDTLRQRSQVFSGIHRSVLLEEGTNTSCPPCASQNPALDAFIAQHFDDIVAVKYHAWWPSSSDPMYAANTSENRNRVYYYSIYGVPDVVMDGITHVYPAYVSGVYEARLDVATPIDVVVKETRIPGDSIQADVYVDILAPLRSGDYRLRLFAVERHISYASPPGSNGEQDFYDVFRRGYPDVAGTPLPTDVGYYSFTFRYKVEAAWVDSMIYSVAFVQDDRTKEVMNCAKARDHLRSSRVVAAVRGTVHETDLIQEVSYRPEPMPGHFAPIEMGAVTSVADRSLEPFEHLFPPRGWRLVNPDGRKCFELYRGASGPSAGGHNSMRMEFYGYMANGQTDTIYSPIYTGLKPIDYVRFDWAFATRPLINNRLVVRLSKDGGRTFPYKIFDRDTLTLPTAPPTYGRFYPTSSQWKTIIYSLDQIVWAEDARNETPAEYSLEQNYPNPFNPSTTIEIALPHSGFVTLKIYNVLGEGVTTLVEGNHAAGTFKATWDASGLPSGVYFYRLVAGEYVQTKKMVLIK